MIWKAFLQVLLVVSSLLYIIYLGYFDQVVTELGVEHYAEEWNVQYIHLPLVPKWLRMPLNSGVNLGYLIVGIYWLVLTEEFVQSETLTPVDGYAFYVFNWMSVFYGPIQCCRIVTQVHGFAVADQWFTLPFFVWVVIWAVYIIKGSWQTGFAILGLIFSLSSYVLAIYHPRGFEIALGLHITLAILFGEMVYQKFPNTGSRNSLFKAVLCCFGFVIIKLLDFELKRLHWIFSYISGHFISKIFDILQIHYVNKVFLHILFTRNQHSEAQSENKKTL